MDAREAEATLALAAERRRQAVAEGTTAWSGKATWSICSSALALGVLIDADMIWLWVLLVLMGVGVAWNRGVRLRGYPASRGWTAALWGTYALAFLAYVLGQGVSRALEVPIPATVGTALASLVIAFVSRPVQARYAASRRR
ncbi:hypothetical protein [Kineococcus arenarius]|uniref:hypothetical protein n=1 Tax=unclassified Kineococcus TaxID=2621656 RepID=UPI003D7DDD79